MNETFGPPDRVRNLVLDWLRAPHREPEFLAEASPSDLHRFHDTIARRFLHWVKDSGFTCEVAEAEDGGNPRYEIRWTHLGSTFVGFKQPPLQRTSEDALLMGCAALLENQWCRNRLPG